MGHPTSNSPHPVKITFGCLILWIFCFPYYLIRRNSFIKSAQEHPQETIMVKGHYVALVIGVAIVIFFALKGFNEGEVPQCGSDEVKSAATKILNNSGIKGTIKGVEQVSYDPFEERRACRGIDSSEQIRDFTVQWYSEKKERFLVQL
jgi:hypothetical protein